MTCAFQLSRYQIERIAVARNENFDRALAEHTGDITASVNISPHKTDKNKYRLTLEILAKPSVGKETSFFPYDIAVKGIGFFLFNGSCNAEEANRTLSVNGAAILHGLLRAQIAQITAQAPYGQFLLPTMNFVEMHEQASSKKKKLSTQEQKTSRGKIRGRKQKA